MATDATNPLLTATIGEYALPDWERIDAAHYLPAFAHAFAVHRAEIESIATDADAPTFENTLVALERSGELLDRISRTFSTVSSADATADIQRVEEALAPLMSAHHDSVTLDSRLFARVAAVYEQRDALGLDPEERYLVERRHRRMSHAGAALDDAQKERLTALNRELSTLTTTFEKNLLADTNDLAVLFESVDDLRDSRERIMAASRARGSRGNEHDNRDVLRAIVRLRAERAALLGYPSHAAYVTADQTAG
ncbi:MAG: peptidase, partial [Microbacterium sp.]|nr:peptidase [Microbacterium sp.]